MANEKVPSASEVAAAKELVKAARKAAKEASGGKTERAKFTGNGKVQSRTVTGFVGVGDKRKQVTYTELKLTDEVKDINEAITLLKLKKREPILALVSGYNARARKLAGSQSGLIKKFADFKGITYDEARKILDM